MLDKLPESYTPFISAMDKEWLDYTSANIHNTIHHITRYLKTNLPKILYARLNTSNMAHSNKRRQIESTSILSPPTSSLSTCKNPICLSKKSQHIVDKYWELHPELHLTRRQNPDSSEIKIKGTASIRPPPSDIPTFETS